MNKRKIIKEVSDFVNEMKDPFGTYLDDEYVLQKSEVEAALRKASPDIFKRSQVQTFGEFVSVEERPNAFHIWIWNDRAKAKRSPSDWHMDVEYDVEGGWLYVDAFGDISMLGKSRHESNLQNMSDRDVNKLPNLLKRMIAFVSNSYPAYK